MRLDKKLIGIYGGTFDPIHFGHLRTALELKEGLGLTTIRLIPARRSPLRDAPFASPQDRLDLIHAALTGISDIIVDQRELDNTALSFTVNTLTALRAEYSEQFHLCLLMGMDAFANLDAWHQPETILQLAHIVVAHRPNWQPPNSGTVAAWLNKYRSYELTDLINYRNGIILTYSVTALDISASAIRRLIANGHNPRFLLPDPALAIIQARNLYT